MAIVFGIGSGLFTLANIWGFAILLSIILSRATGRIKMLSMVLIVIAVLITVLLIIWPKEAVGPDPNANRITDGMFWTRVIILGFICIFSLLCLVFMFIFHWTEPIYAKPIKSKRF